MAKTKVFVYGTLMRGRGNHHVYLLWYPIISSHGWKGA
ncbi:MAG TPA: hypothetical protein DEA47_00890 [Peptococcaceae bacterium]|nr:hypothetical protein [Peptococcaceae bacterium]